MKINSLVKFISRNSSSYLSGNRRLGSKNDLVVCGRRCVHTFINESYRIPGREEQIQQLKTTPEFDILVIGGGSTGAGIITFLSHLLFF